jgi:ammonia channel protein AmtB
MPTVHLSYLVVALAHDRFHQAIVVFGLMMIGFFTQSAFAAVSGNPNLPNGLLFGGGLDALHQLGLEALAAVVVIAVVFALTYATLEVIAWAMHGITTDYKEEEVPIVELQEGQRGTQAVEENQGLTW